MNNFLKNEFTYFLLDMMKDCESNHWPWGSRGLEIWETCFVEDFANTHILKIDYMWIVYSWTGCTTLMNWGLIYFKAV